MIKKILSPILQFITFIIVFIISFGTTVTIDAVHGSELVLLVLYALISAALFYGINIIIIQKLESKQTVSFVTHIRSCIGLYVIFIYTNSFLVVNSLFNLSGGYAMLILMTMEIALVGIVTNAIFLSSKKIAIK